MDSSEAFVTTGSVYVSAYRNCLLLVPIPCLDMKKCYKLDFPCHYQFETKYEMWNDASQYKSEARFWAI